ncbi:MAG: NUDIX domain-containing protein [Planctomycetota bacterium]
MKHHPTGPVRAAGVILLHAASVLRVEAANEQAASETAPIGVVYGRGQRPQSFLIMRHADRWDWPKGHCDGNETFLETAIRETQEETGIGIRDFCLDPDFEFDLHYAVTGGKSAAKKHDKLVRYFLGWIEHQPEIMLSEHVGYEWRNWSPPHSIQDQTIDPLLAAVEQFLSGV